MLKAATTALAVLFAFPAIAQVTYDAGTKSLKIFGATSTYQKVMVSREFDANEVDTVYMKGPGGEMYAGFEIGRMIKASGARVIIPSGADCISACSLGAMATENLQIDGRILIHRPFMMGVPALLPIEDVAARFGLGYLDYSRYLEEIGYSSILARQILEQTSPCKFILVDDVKYLERAKQYGSITGYAFEDKCGA